MPITVRVGYFRVMRLSEKLLKQMLIKGLNGQKLARLSGVSDSEVSRILSGKSQPGLENAFRLARAVGVSLDYLADDGMDADPNSSAALAGDREILDLSKEVGHRSARRILEMTLDLGPEIAIRRLLGADSKPVIEVGESSGRSLSASPTQTASATPRANTA